MRIEKGFTLIELIMVMLVMSILAVYAAPRFDALLFRQDSFFIEAMSSVRYAQKQAIASGCNTEVNITNSNCLVSWSNPSADANCPANGTSIPSPSSGNNNYCNNRSTAAGVPTGGNFRFDNIGRPMDTGNNILVATQNIVIGDRTILVEAETGFTHEN